LTDRSYRSGAFILIAGINCLLPLITQNAYIESFNGKLRDECLNQEIFYSLKEAQVVIEAWRHEYNRVRPHSSLGYRPPAPATYRPNQLTLARPHALQWSLNALGTKKRSAH